MTRDIANGERRADDVGEPGDQEGLRGECRHQLRRRCPDGLDSTEHRGALEREQREEQRDDEPRDEDVTPMIWLNVAFCSLIPGMAMTASSRVSVVVVPVAASIASRRRRGRPPVRGRPRAGLEHAVVDGRSGRDSARTWRQVSGSTRDSAPCWRKLRVALRTPRPRAGCAWARPSPRRPRSPRRPSGTCRPRPGRARVAQAHRRCSPRSPSLRRRRSRSRRRDPGPDQRHAEAVGGRDAVDRLDDATGGRIDARPDDGSRAESENTRELRALRPQCSGRAEEEAVEQAAQHEEQHHEQRERRRGGQELAELTPQLARASLTGRSRPERSPRSGRS